MNTIIPVTKTLLADFHTPISLLNRFCYDESGNIRDGVFLLESVEGGEKWGRNTILGVEAHAFVNVDEDNVVIQSRGGNAAIPHNGKPLNVLRELMNKYKIETKSPDTGDKVAGSLTGLVGYFTYEFVSFFEKIPHKLKDEPLAKFVIPKTLLILDNIKQTLTVCVLVYHSPHTEGCPKDGVVEAEKKHPYPSKGGELKSAQKQIDNIVQKLAEPLATPQPATTLRSVAGSYEGIEMNAVLSEGDFRKRVEKVKEHIRNGDIIQCVISQPFIAENAPNPVSLYRALRFANPSPYLFFISLGGTTLVGSSPETMVKLEGRKATLRPIAGTRKRGETEQRDRELADEMLQDPKERAEHLMLVDLGRNDLGRLAKTGTVQVTDLMFIERYANVMHLVSNVTAELESQYDGFDLFEAAFPAGTLTGAPKVRAMEIIAEMEDFPRRAYGGAAGYISFDGNIDFAITIRTAMIQDGKLTAQAGAGVVYDSVPELERKESVNKALGITKALEMLK